MVDRETNIVTTSAGVLRVLVEAGARRRQSKSLSRLLTVQGSLNGSHANPMEPADNLQSFRHGFGGTLIPAAGEEPHFPKDKDPKLLGSCLWVFGCFLGGPFRAAPRRLGAVSLFQFLRTPYWRLRGPRKANMSSHMRVLMFAHS